MRRVVAYLAASIALSVGTMSAAQAQNHVAILMPGAGGAVPGDFLMRNQGRIESAGIRTIVTTSPAQAASISQSETAKGNKVIIVAMSLGVTHAASTLASGAKVKGAVFVSGVYDEAKSNLGSASLLPTTLMIHHAADKCRLTTPEIARSFAQWSGGKATIRWINTSGGADPRPCGPNGAHGFFLQDGPAVSAITNFIRSR